VLCCACFYMHIFVLQVTVILHHSVLLRVYIRMHVCCTCCNRTMQMTVIQACAELYL
jgi:hypothetical protein